MLTIDYGNLHAAAVGLPAIGAIVAVFLFSGRWRR
jgi:hypothetical protein